MFAVEVELGDNFSPVDQRLGQVVDLVVDRQVHCADNLEAVFNGDCVAVIIDRRFAVGQGLQESQAVKTQQVDFVEDDGRATLHCETQGRRLEDRVAVVVVEVEGPHELVGQHACIARYDLCVRVLFDGLGRLTCAGVAEVDVQALVDLFLGRVLDKVGRDGFELGTLQLFGNVVCVRIVDESHVAGHVGPSSRHVLTQGKGIHEPGSRLEFELAEEFLQAADRIDLKRLNLVVVQNSRLNRLGLNGHFAELIGQGIKR